MSDSTLQLNFQALILRVAEFLGLADYSGGAAAIPSNAHDLDLCKRMVNDGYRRFVNSRATWNWQTPLVTITFSAQYTGTATSAGANTLTDTGRTEGVNFFNTFVLSTTGGTGSGQVVTVTAWNSGTKQFTVSPPWTTVPDTTTTYTTAPATCVNGDNARYYMPDGFTGSVLSPWTYPATGPRKRITIVDEGTIRQLQAGGTVSGDPIHVAFRPAPSITPASTGKRWEAIFWPTPAVAYTVTSRARLYPDALANLSDESIAGPLFDDAILSCALAEAERSRNDEEDVQGQNAERALARAMQLDSGGAPPSLGDYGDRSDGSLGGRPGRPLSYYAVDTYNGSTL